MRILNLNPTGREVLKITYPAVESTSRKITIEPMRFLYPYEAKREAQVYEGQQARCHHNCRKALREALA